MCDYVHTTPKTFLFNSFSRHSYILKTRGAALFRNLCPLFLCRFEHHEIKVFIQCPDINGHDPWLHLLLLLTIPLQGMHQWSLQLLISCWICAPGTYGWTVWASVECEVRHIQHFYIWPALGLSPTPFDFKSNALPTRQVYMWYWRLVLDMKFTSNKSVCFLICPVSNLAHLASVPAIPVAYFMPHWPVLLNVRWQPESTGATPVINPHLT